MSTNIEFYARRQQLAEHMQPNSICLIPAALLVTRSRDTEYDFRQDSYFHYLCGFPEPQAWLAISNQTLKRKTKAVQSHSVLFCLDKDHEAEIWQGRRFGPDLAKKHFGFDSTFGIDELDEQLLELLDGHDNLYFAQGHNSDADELVFALLKALREAPKQSMQAPGNMVDVRPLLDEMRLFKSPAEIAIMRQAAQISGKAHIRAMQSAQVGLNEYHLEAHIHHEFAMHGAKHPAYGTIVGSGDNACILHYTQNNQRLNDGDLVLIDAGCELQGYAADITRTFPVSGQFSTAQKQLYQLVLDSQLAAFEQVKPGNTFKQVSDAAIAVITQGLIDLGLLCGSLAFNLDKQLYRNFFMHGIGHWLGLDVHDVGHYKIAGQDRPLQAGMVLTIEPGIYVSPDADVDEIWLGVGIRIEDNLLVTADGFDNLTHNTPKTIVAIESLMAQQHTHKQVEFS
ncbi:Xaa-Pro aminopeptidase [Paraglaciecola sp.]|uniref:Xaa-Pro aminopeptidase n=1 Tax=Paraglaciecola sp. TaxID=1920173 RepID=UPI0030F390E5